MGTLFAAVAAARRRTVNAARLGGGRNVVIDQLSPEGQHHRHGRFFVARAVYHEADEAGRG